MSSGRRFRWRWLLIGAGGFALLVGLLAVLLVVTPTGARLVVGRALAYSPVPVSVDAVDGRLLGPITLSGIELDVRGVGVRARRVVLDWRPTRLLSKRLVIDSLYVTGVDIDVPEGAPTPPPDAQPAEEAGEEGPPTMPELPVELDVRALRIELERLVWADRGELRESVLSGSGSLDSLGVDVALRGAAAPVEDFEARVSLTGAPEDYRLSADLDFTSTGLPPVAAMLSASGSLSNLDVGEARVRTADGEAWVVARTRWYPTVEWDVQATAEGLAVAPFTPAPEEWPGELSFRASTSGTFGHAGIEAAARVEDLEGTLRDQALEGGLELEVRPDDLHLDRLQLRWGGLHLEAEGALLEELDLALALDVPDVGLAVPGGSGSARLEGSLTGTRAAPHLTASFGADDAGVDSLHLGRAEGTLDIDALAGAPSAVDVRVTDLAWGTRWLLDRVALTGGGSRDAHEGVLTVHTSGLDGELRVSGSLSTPDPPGSAAIAWDGTIDALTLGTESAGDWSLDAPATLHAAADLVALGESCLTQLAARVCAAVQRTGTGSTDGTLRLEALPLALIGRFLPEGTTVDGTAEAEADFSVAADRTLSAEASLRATGALETRVGEGSVRFALAGEGLRVVVDEAGVVGGADFALAPAAGGEALEVSGEVRIPGYTSLATPLAEEALEGALEAASEDLSFLSALTPMVTDVGGEMSLEATVAGTVGEPVVRGSLTLREGRADVPTLGLELRELEVRATGDPGGGVELGGSLVSGEGRLQLEGRSPRAPSPGDAAELRLSGERVQAMGTPEIVVEISPDIEVRYDGATARVEGRVSVPYARIELLAIPPTAVAPSDDVVFVGEEPAAPPQVDATIAVSVGDDVSFRGFGLASMIEGDLEIREEPGEPPLVSGELRLVDGRFAAYGQYLSIEDPGRIVFSGGPPDDATLDVRAMREAQDGTTAGVVVSGSVETPEIEVTSDPAMSDADVLSYIMYGRPLDEGNPSEQEQVVGVAALVGANVVTERLVSTLGLDEARIEGGLSEAQLVAGKYLAPSLYVSYGVGLLRPASTFRIKYLLGSSWAVEAESGGVNGGDLLYQIER